MFNEISKFFYFLLDPWNWLLISLAVALLWRKRKRVRQWALGTAIGLLLIFGNHAIFRTTFMAWQPAPRHTVHTRAYPMGVVLTGMTMANPQREVFFGSTADRFLQTARLYHTGAIKGILICGGNASASQDRPTEADFLKQEFQALGIPGKDILMEKRSRNTWENALAAKRVVDSLKITDSLVLVTSAIHMRRAQACFAKAGVRVKPHPANFEVLDKQFGILGAIIPSIGTVMSWKYLVKEMVGLMVYRLTGKA